MHLWRNLGYGRRTYPSDIKDEEWALYQQWTRWRDVRVFGAIIHDLNALQRRLLEYPATPLGYRAGQPHPAKHARERAPRRLGRSQRLRVVITPANEQERTQVLNRIWPAWGTGAGLLGVDEHAPEQGEQGQ